MISGVLTQLWNTMNFTKNRIWIVSPINVVIILLALVLGFKFYENVFPGKNSTSCFSVKTIELSTGYGYEIIYENKVIIKQEIIPSVSSNISFHTENDAKRTAQLVVGKLKKRKIPSVSRGELDSLKIQY
jgi:hypothetical protein